MLQYHDVRGLSPFEQAEALTRALVRIPSINGTEGERDIASAIMTFVRSVPYFRNHPSHLWLQPLEHDALCRHNVFAIIRGTSPATTGRTVVFHAHMDTVGIEDFGRFAPDAFDSDALQAHFSSRSSPEVVEDATSGEWMFGRGALDMKSGIAVHLVNLLYYAEHPEALRGNLLFMFNPVEENQHTGVMTALSDLERCRIAFGLDYVLAINTDFTSPLYTSDPHRYIYTGAVGKLLPCFYIQGRATHVGETLTGVDPTLVSSAINLALNNQLDFAESIPGEVVLPPSCLQQRDGKAFYNVQTASTARVYFNYFVYEDDVTRIMDRLCDMARTACKEVARQLSAAYTRFTEQSRLPHRPLSWDIEVLSFRELIDRAKQQGVDVDALTISQVQRSHRFNEGDARDQCFQLVESILTLVQSNVPTTVVFFAPPYCPHHALPQEHPLHGMIHAALMELSAVSPFQIKRFFPYLSDSSYLRIDEDHESITALRKNFPLWDEQFGIPVDAIQSLNIPAINVGVYGKDAHRPTERVHKPYSFGELPNIIRRLTDDALAMEHSIGEVNP